MSTLEEQVIALKYEVTKLTSKVEDSEQDKIIFRRVVEYFLDNA